MENELQCAHCGTFDGVMVCTIAGQTQPLCPECQRAMLAQTRGMNAPTGEKPQINYLTGTLGALAGALLGLLIGTIIDALGSILIGNIVGGIALGLLTVLGFRKTGHGLGVGGFLICAVISMPAAYLLLQIAYALLLTRELAASNVTFFDAVQIMPALKARGLLDMDIYNKILRDLLCDTGIGLLSTIIPSWKKKKAAQKGEKAHEEEN